jgi:hypothetical protein
MSIGSKKHLEQEDLWDLSEQHKAAELYQKYYKCMLNTADRDRHPFVRLLHSRPCPPHTFRMPSSCLPHAFLMPSPCLPHTCTDRSVAQHIAAQYRTARAVKAQLSYEKLLYIRLSACPRSVSVAVCSVIACYVLLVGAAVADVAMPAGERVFAAALVHSCLRPLSLPPFSRVAWRCPPSFRPLGGAEAEARLG